jgi:very-short-patch-repair endonuclease
MTQNSNSVLAAIVPTLGDWDIILRHGWYRIPTTSAPAMVRDSSIEVIAFYFPKIFGEQGGSIRWYSSVISIDKKHRTELFPEEPINAKSSKNYFILRLGELKPLAAPILSHKPRRILFIPTTSFKLFNATDINDIFSDSHLEELLWHQLKQYKIKAERQLYLEIKRSRFILDFAIFCTEGNINIECDGDAYHLSEKQVKMDKIRNNYLTSSGWQVLRFSTNDIERHMAETMHLVRSTIKQSGGLRIES